jgi:hypothetical protein
VDCDPKRENKRLITDFYINGQFLSEQGFTFSAYVSGGMLNFVAIKELEKQEYKFILPGFVQGDTAPSSGGYNLFTLINNGKIVESAAIDWSGGQIRYKSDLPFVPEPAAYGLFFAFCLFGFGLLRKYRK